MYAVKVLDRNVVDKGHMIEYVANEEEILRSTPKHPFLISFYKQMKDINFIYFVMDLVQG